MARVYVALFLLGLIFAILALISCLSAEEGQVRSLPRLAWVAIILLFPLLGSIAYYYTGRPARAAAAGSVWPFGPPPASPKARTLAPDDDPEFLRRIDPRNRNGDSGPGDS
jgi:phospholipase D-like protein